MNFATAMDARMLTLLIGIGATAFLGSATLSHSAGSDPVETTTQNCPTGQTWSEQAGKCVIVKSNKLNDDERYTAGWKLAKAGEYARAINVLKTIRNQRDPKVLTYLGFSHRKLGDFSEGLAYYKQALAIDPDFVRAREYLGEGYIVMGKVDLAKQQLAEIKSRCGTGCAEYKQLAHAIATGRENSW